MSRSIVRLSLLFVLSLCGAAPANKPELFGANVISTQDDEFSSAFTTDGRQIYFAKKSPTTQRSSVVLICTSVLEKGAWSTPTIAPFSGPYKDLSPCITPDGSRFYFVSTRPIDDKPKPDADIWYMDKAGPGWGTPVNAGKVINSDLYEQSISVASSGTIYFSSTRDRRSLDIYRSRFVNGNYEAPENVGEAINSPDFNEQDVFVAPDESYMLFSCVGRPDAIVATEGAAYPRSDLYISVSKEGKWSAAVNLGPLVNSTADEAYPFVSRDGKTLYFTSERNFASAKNSGLTYDELIKKLRGPGNGLGDIYAIPFEPVMKAVKK
jgi:hypothetical protein